jgi:hypothetical protein
LSSEHGQPIRKKISHGSEAGCALDYIPRWIAFGAHAAAAKLHRCDRISRQGVGSVNPATRDAPHSGPALHSIYALVEQHSAGASLLNCAAPPGSPRNSDRLSVF